MQNAARFTTRAITVENFESVKENVRGRLSSITCAENLSILIDLSKLGDPKTSISLAADLLFEMVQDPARLVHPLSPRDTIIFITACSRMRVIDSELFPLLESQIARVDNVQDLVGLVKAMTRLENGVFFSKQIYDFIHSNSTVIVEEELRSVLVPILRYVVVERGLSGVTREDSDSVIRLVLHGFHQKICSLKKDKQLVISRALVTGEDVYNIVTLLGSYGRLMKGNGGPQLSKAARDDLVYACKSIVAYEVRAWDNFEKLIKFFFACSELNLFDDFFIRRRLVPAIVNVYNGIRDKTERDKVLVKTMVDMLPFENDMVRDLKTTAIH